MQETHTPEGRRLEGRIPVRESPGRAAFIGPYHVLGPRTTQRAQASAIVDRDLSPKAPNTFQIVPGTKAYFSSQAVHPHNWEVGMCVHQLIVLSGSRE
ncbi:hypothetical protein N7468_007950 [Penicillium chermesinum]|uniref:Uncharacterized protein n=1 Tax=Penicillium chermesinum TaxID=63820 RepID=A0A9W9NP86_9EURO|nr:uncharacterized protein N7468_007950 [Penicillium chermesinum]KAJ5223408.1 hypothetical protein N7468_007950 [Penicillium chermesinum]